MSIAKLRRRLGRQRRRHQSALELAPEFVPAEPTPEREPLHEPEVESDPNFKSEIRLQDIQNSLTDFEKYLIPKAGDKNNAKVLRSMQAATQFLSWLANPARSIGKAVMFGKIVIVVLDCTILIAYYINIVV